jgi:hypothetical protein
MVESYLEISIRRSVAAVHRAIATGKEHYAAIYTRNLVRHFREWSRLNLPWRF